MLEAAIEEHLRKVVKRLGGHCWKLPANLYRGIPDRLVLVPGGGVHFVELKRPGEKVRDTGRQGSQGRLGWWLQEHGFNWVCLDTKVGVDEYFGGEDAGGNSYE